MNEFNRLRRNILLNSGGGLPDGYEWATDADFSGTANGKFTYRGSKQYVAIPHTIRGINVTSYRRMFSGESIKGVYSDNMNITDMEYMLWNTTSTTLDVTYLNTSSVTNMSSMFSVSKATEINGLQNFDTSKVTDMSNMFNSSQATSLDLSSFDTSKVTNKNYMFSYSKATTGYARTQADANRFNTGTGKPSGLTFVVKPK